MQKKKKKKFPHMDGGQLKNVCLSVVCDEFILKYLLNHWSDLDKFFLQKLEKCVFENFNPEVQGQHPRVKALG